MNEILPTEESPKLKAMSKAGATREVGYKVMVEGLNAVKTIDTIIDGERKTIEEPDHNVRHKFMDSFLRSIGDIKPELSVDNRQVKINMTGVSPESVAGLLSMVSDVKMQLASLKRDGRQTGEIIDV